MKSKDEFPQGKFEHMSYSMVTAAVSVPCPV